MLIHIHTETQTHTHSGSETAREGGWVGNRMAEKFYMPMTGHLPLRQLVSARLAWGRVHDTDTDRHSSVEFSTYLSIFAKWPHFPCSHTTSNTTFLHLGLHFTFRLNNHSLITCLGDMIMHWFHILTILLCHISIITLIIIHLVNIITLISSQVYLWLQRAHSKL